MRTGDAATSMAASYLSVPKARPYPTNSALIKKCEELAHGLAREQRKHVAILEREIDELEH